jgi:predicted transposase/invertase (TIGR01784 family)
LLKGERYELLQPTYVICWLNEALFADAAYHHRFRAYDNENQVLLCKDLEIHVLELSKFDVPVEAVKTPLERWCSFLKHGASLDVATLPATLDVPVIRQALEVLMKLSQEELERQRARDRLWVQRDAADLIATAKAAQQEAEAAQQEAKAAQQEAKAARQEGIEIGIDKGVLIGSIQTLQRLLKQPQTPRAELSQLSEEQLVQREESLNQQLNGPKGANGTPPANQP